MVSKSIKAISIVVPTLNEEKNVNNLVTRIDHVCHRLLVNYEIIFIDDHSSDNTVANLRKLAKKYPIRVCLKKGQPGKAQSLLEGFKLAKFGLIAMIDADLQYPPEAIVEMFQLIKSNQCDIVVANRTEQNTPWIRQIANKAFRSIFAKYLHNLSVDVQSGLKLFRKEIIDRLEMNPSPWTFDLEFLIQARHAGYRIGSVNIFFSDRLAGDSKVKFFKTVWEIGSSAIKLKFKQLPLISFSPEKRLLVGNGFNYKQAEFIHHTDLHPSELAFHQVTPVQFTIITLGIILLGSGLYLNLYVTLLMFIGLLTALYFLDLLFSVFMVFRSFNHVPEIKIATKEISALPDSFWPSYTIFSPLYKEWEVVPQFVSAINRLDYPKDKLQVQLLLEENDKETIAKVKEFELPNNFQIIIVPHSLPKTKPKACNFGLKYATGEFAVIYDAEDVPDPLQLKKAVMAFKKAGKQTWCIQAKLNYYNPNHNLLTKLFTAEYSLWFDLILPGLQSISAPIPLGGTSNHFRTANLRILNGWDPFNVTEDCDLGIRLVKRGYKTAIVESTTLEEANSEPFNWYRQRSRWIKGYIQSYLVHMRSPKSFKRGVLDRQFWLFQLIVGGKILSMFINPVMWLVTISYFAFRSIMGPVIEQYYPAPILYMGVFSLVFGNFFYLYNYMIGCAKRKHYGLIKYTFLIPFYWLAMSLAAWKALFEVIYKPHYWAKTTHGLHLKQANVINQSENNIGRGLIDAHIKVYPNLSTN